jgi:PKD repeat protein
VTATSGAATAKITVDLRPRVGLTLTGPREPPAAGLPATFEVGVAEAANVTDVTVNFGDGRRQSLGAITGRTTVQHTYRDPGTYTVRATATEATGEVTTVSTAITILPAQPPGVIINVSDTTPTPGQIVTLTASVSGATSTVLRYEWDFGDGTSATTTGNQITKSWAVANTYVIRVTVVQASGPSGQGQTTVDVGP